MKRWEFTGETKLHYGITLRRIRATMDFTLKCGFEVHKGDNGGWIEKEGNLYGNAWVYGDAEVYGKNDILWFKNCWSSGRCFTYTRSNKKWAVGCFYGTGDELIAKAYKDSALSGKCYEATVKYVEQIYAAIDAAKEAN